MKSIFFVVAFCLALASCQPASTNPADEDYFSPAVVWNLPLNTTVNGTLYNTTDYSEFYMVWVPFNVAGVRYTINNTDDNCNNYVALYVSFVETETDYTVSFPCRNSNGNAFCENYDQSFDVYDLDGDYEEYNVANYYRPGKYHMVQMTKYYNYDAVCPYYLRVETTASCAATETLGVEDYYTTPTCIANSAIQNVTASGQTFTKTFTSTAAVDAYRVDVPQNVSRVWAVVTSTVSDLNLYVAAGWVSTYYYYSDDYDESGSSADNNLYSYNVEIELPDGNYPVFFSVETETSLVSYNISIYWSACGAAFAGIGDIGFNYGNATSFFYINDCTDPVVYNNIDLLNANQGLVFSVPAYNSTTDSNYASAYGYINVPFGTVGSVNFTCNSTTDNAFMVFTKGSTTDCNDYAEYIYCNTPTYTTSDYLYLLSNDLYPGGYWSVAACSSQSAVANSIITINTSGSVAAAPSASPSSGSVPSASSSPGASSSSGEDSSVSAAVFPALLVIALAAIIAF